MPTAPRTQHLSVDPTAVIANQDPQGLDGILEFNFDLACAGVADGVYQRFSTDSIDFIVGRGMQRPRRTPDNEPKGYLADSLLYGKFFVAS